MLPILKRYAWILGGLTLLTGLYLVVEIPDDEYRLGWIVSAVGAVLIALNLIVGFDRARKEEFLRGVRYGTSTVVVTAILVVLLVLLNLIGSRHYLRWDLTETGIHTLSPASVELLAELGDPVKIVVFDPLEIEAQRRFYREFLDRYTTASELIDYEFVDPNRDPARLDTYPEVKQGEIVVANEAPGRESRWVTIGELNEETLGNALISVSRDDHPLVCYLQGHGERDIEAHDTIRGIGVTNGRLGDQGFRFAELYLVETGVVPQTCDILAVVSPYREFLQAELDVITGYLDNGGASIWLLDPDMRGQLNLNEFMQRYNVELGNDVVIDTVNRLYQGNPTIPVIAEFDPRYERQDHPVGITRGLREPVYFPVVQTVSPYQVSGGVTVDTFLKTERNSYAETDLQALLDEEQVGWDEGERTGAMGIAVARYSSVDNADGESVLQKMVVIGDSDFISNQYGSPGNRRLYGASLNWLLSESRYLAIPSVNLGKSLNLTEAEARVILYLSLAGFPALLLIVSVFMWRRRKRL